MDILSIFTSPSKVFSSLKERPKWVLPLVIVVVVTLIATILILSSRIGLDMRLAALKARNLPPEQLERAQRFIKGPLPVITGSISVLIATPIWMVIVAFIYNLCLPLVGGKGNFLKTFSVVSYSAMVRIPGIILRTLLIFIKKTPFVYTSLILFFPKIPHHSFGARFLSRLDIFTIWELILIALGLEIITDVKGKKTYYLVFGIWLLYLLLTSLFFGRFRPGIR